MSKSLHGAIALLSAALLAYQIVLLQAFSIVQWYHFAYMVISVALLGFGASGTVLSLGREWFVRHAREVLPATMLLAGLSMPISLALSQLPFARFESYLLLSEPGQLASLAVTYLLLTVPFFFGALAIGLAFVTRTERMGTLYFANLIGSGAGGSLGLLFLYVAFPPTLGGATGLLAIAGAGLLTRHHRGRVLRAVWLLAVAAVALLTLRPPPLRPSQYKDLQRALLIPDAAVIATRSHPMGTVQIVRSGFFRAAPGLSLTYDGDVPSQDLLFINGDMSRTLGTGQSARLLSHTTSALPYRFLSPKRVLILGGIRVDAIAIALESGADHVTVLEPHGGVRAVLTVGEIAEANRVLSDPRVELRGDEARTYLATSRRAFDLIVLADIGSFGGSGGLFALHEQYDLTLEAMHLAWSHLAPDGAIAVTVWMDYPPRNPLRVLATFSQMIRENGHADVPSHLTSIRGWGAISFVAHRDAMSDHQARSVGAWADSMLFDPLFLPGAGGADRQLHNLLQDSTLLVVADTIVSGNVRNLYRRYPFRIRPTTDEAPYFSQFLKWSRLGEAREMIGRSRFAFFEVGTLAVGITLVQILLLAVVLIVLPLVRHGWAGRGRLWTVSYFGGLAVGYMFFELVMIQRFTLYLGHAVTAVAYVFTVLLASSGLGSLFSSRVAPHRRTLTVVTGASGAALMAVLVLGPSLMASTMGVSLAARLLIGSALLVPAGLLMGMPFPLGLRALDTWCPSHVPWAWAVNGCLSVASAPAAVLLSAEAGATVVLATAAIAYGAVSISGRLLHPPRA